LTVSEQAGIVAIESVVEHIHANVLEHFILVGVFGSWLCSQKSVLFFVKPIVGPITVVEGKFFLLSVSWILDCSLGSIHIDNQTRIHFLFSAVERPATHCHLNTRHFLFS
jgi:hypothetical protein